MRRSGNPGSSQSLTPAAHVSTPVELDTLMYFKFMLHLLVKQKESKTKRMSEF